MDFYKDMSILKLDEIRELILNLSSAQNNIDFTSLITTISNTINTAVDDLKADLVSSENTTLEDAIKTKIIEVYTTLNNNLTSLSNAVSSSTITINDISTAVSNISTTANTILNNIATLSTMLQNKQCGLTSEQAQMLSSILSSTTQLGSDISTANTTTSQILSNTIQIIDTLNNSSGGSSGGTSEVDLSEVLNKLYNLQLNMQQVLDKLDLANQDMQEEPPYDPPPENVYITRSSFTSPFIYNITAPLDLEREFFTINDDVPAVVKIEFDITTTNSINDIVLTLHLGDNQTLLQKPIIVASGTTHFCYTETFITSRTDYYLMLNFSSASLLQYTVSNVEYEVAGNNANFLSYKHMFYTCNYNFYNYIFKEENGKMSYIKVDALNPNYSQNYTTIVNNNNYIYMPVLGGTINGATNGSRFMALRILAQEKSTRNVVAFDENGTNKGSCQHTASNGHKNFSTVLLNSNFNVVMNLRYSPITKIMNVNYFYNSMQNTANYSGQDLSSRDTIVEISPCIIEQTHNLGYFNYPYVILTTCKGQNYVANGASVNFNNAIGYGTKVRVGEIPNFNGTVRSDNNTKVFRAFLYVYDHWKVVYYKHANDIAVNGFQILGTKILNGNYEELHPGFNGEYYAVQNGQIFTFDDPDVVKVAFN